MSENYEKQIRSVVGHNAKIAREIAGLTCKEAQKLIWGYKNEDMFANRISELESGRMKIELKIVHKLCEVYGCSADFIFGFSEEFEREDLVTKRTGLVFQSVQSAVLENTRVVCEQMSRALNNLPPMQGELLKGAARAVVDNVNDLRHDLAFRGQYPQLIDLTDEMSRRIVQFDTMLAKQMRYIEMSYMTMLEGSGEPETGIDGKKFSTPRKLTKQVTQPKTLKVQV
jgi:transcriptional regulator with XRE-family HTH domain